MAEVGDILPEFVLESHDRQQINLSQYKGEKFVVFSTFPFAFTSG